jgi:hypothetical protein
MRIRLIETDEPTRALPIGESVLHVRRIPATVQRDVERRNRRTLRTNAQNDPEAMARYMESVEDDLLDYALVRWEGVWGDPPCTRENKLKLSSGPREGVFRVARSDAAEFESEQEAITKNSDAPSSTPTE